MKLKFYNNARFFLSSAVFAATQAIMLPTAQADSKLAEQYSRAVADAAVIEQDEIDKGLFAINDGNEQLIWNEDKSKLLVLTWKSNDGFKRYIEPNTKTSPSEEYVTWVTAAPQLKNFCSGYLKNNPQATKEDLDLRLKQYLGLSHEWQYDVFAELWVSPEDLFRPCVDPKIDDSTCELNFSDNPKVRNIADYQQFYKNLYFKDFRRLPGVPWTGLGYTFDWGGREDHDVGASEYILVPNSTYEIKDVYTTSEYCEI
jgi:hypothetical protein